MTNNPNETPLTVAEARHKCEAKDCPLDATCFHYCDEHHRQICLIQRADMSTYFAPLGRYYRIKGDY